MERVIVRFYDNVGVRKRQLPLFLFTKLYGSAWFAAISAAQIPFAQLINSDKPPRLAVDGGRPLFLFH